MDRLPGLAGSAPIALDWMSNQRPVAVPPPLQTLHGEPPAGLNLQYGNSHAVIDSFTTEPCLTAR